jgi:8-oxo-dGTP pyrophosphatase MutT (NUDIX family)
MARKTTLDLVNECDNFPYRYDDVKTYDHTVSAYYCFKLEGCPSTLGYVTPNTVSRLPLDKHWSVDHANHTLIFQPQSATNLEDRNAILAEYLQRLRQQHIFQVLEGWRDELYPIYGPNRELILSMERSASALFGVVTYGVHMTAYVASDGESGMKIWAPRRAETKQTYPGMMDNTVAGGLSTGEEPLECLIRECEEEASIPENIARQAKSCGTLTYFHIRDARAGGETGLCQPECQYVYDLELPSDFVPKPGDDEAIDFKLLSIAEVQEALADGKFKPNCALLLVEFLVRHGFLTPEGEPDYIEIVSRLHRKMEFPLR